MSAARFGAHRTPAQNVDAMAFPAAGIIPSCDIWKTEVGGDASPLDSIHSVLWYSARPYGFASRMA